MQLAHCPHNDDKNKNENKKTSTTTREIQCPITTICCFCLAQCAVWLYHATSTHGLPPITTAVLQGCSTNIYQCLHVQWVQMSKGKEIKHWTFIAQSLKEKWRHAFKKDMWPCKIYSVTYKIHMYTISCEDELLYRIIGTIYSLVHFSFCIYRYVVSTKKKKIHKKIEKIYAKNHSITFKMIQVWKMYPKQKNTINEWMRMHVQNCNPENHRGTDTPSNRQGTIYVCCECALRRQ